MTRGALAECATLDGLPAKRPAALAGRRGRPIHDHCPSPVEPTGTVSNWGGHIHRAVDFQAQGKRPSGSAAFAVRCGKKERRMRQRQPRVMSMALEPVER